MPGRALILGHKSGSDGSPCLLTLSLILAGTRTMSLLHLVGSRWCLSLADRQSLDWIGVAASFLSIRFLSVVLGIVGMVLLVSVIVWVLERRRTAEFGGPPVDGLVCSISWSTQAMAKADPSVEPKTLSGRLLGGAWAAASVALIAMFAATLQAI